MKDDMTLWEPVANQLKDLSITGLQTLRDLIDHEIEVRRKEFLTPPTEPKKSERPFLRVVKSEV